MKLFLAKRYLQINSALILVFLIITSVRRKMCGLSSLAHQVTVRAATIDGGATGADTTLAERSHATLALLEPVPPTALTRSLCTHSIATPVPDSTIFAVVGRRSVVVFAARGSCRFLEEEHQAVEGDDESHEGCQRSHSDV